MRNDDLVDLTDHELLEVVVGELRALRRLIGLIFLVAVFLSVAFPVAAVAGSG